MDLSNNDLSDVTAIEAVNNCLLSDETALVRLDISKCRITDTAVREFLAEGISRWRVIQYLDVSDNIIKNEGGSLMVEGLRENVVLQHLDLSMNALDHYALNEKNQLIARNVKIKHEKKPQMYRLKLDKLDKAAGQLGQLKSHRSDMDESIVRMQTVVSDTLKELKKN